MVLFIINHHHHTLPIKHNDHITIHQSLRPNQPENTIDAIMKVVEHEISGDQHPKARILLGLWSFSLFTLFVIYLGSNKDGSLSITNMTNKFYRSNPLILPSEPEPEPESELPSQAQPSMVSFLMIYPQALYMISWIPYDMFMSTFCSPTCTKIHAEMS